MNTISGRKDLIGMRHSVTVMRATSLIVTDERSVFRGLNYDVHAV